MQILPPIPAPYTARTGQRSTEAKRWQDNEMLFVNFHKKILEISKYTDPTRLTFDCTKGTLLGKNTVYSIPEILFWKIRNEFLIYHTWNNGISEKIWKISNVYRPKTPPTTPRSLFWHINCAVPKWKILNMVLDVYKSHDISLHLNWKDVSTVLWSCSGTGVRELSKFKWAFTNFFKLAQTKRPSKWQLEWILGRLGPGQLGPVHFVKIHKW